MTDRETKAVEVLNFYRNCHYADSSATESYKLANAINDILPEFVRLANERDERSKGSMYCTEWEDLLEYFKNGKPVGAVFDTCISESEDGRRIELPSGVDIVIRFCPVCGRPLKGEKA